MQGQTPTNRAESDRRQSQLSCRRSSSSGNVFPGSDILAHGAGSCGSRREKAATFAGRGRRQEEMSQSRKGQEFAGIRSRRGPAQLPHRSDHHTPTTDPRGRASRRRRKKPVENGPSPWAQRRSVEGSGTRLGLRAWCGLFQQHAESAAAMPGAHQHTVVRVRERKQREEGGRPLATGAATTTMPIRS